MLKRLNTKTNKGFTIIEVLITILILTTGGLAAYSMVQQIVFSTFASSYRLTAAYLAKEGIETVRNMRDTNWLDPTNPSWSEGLENTGWITHTELPKYQTRTTITSNVADELKVYVDVQWTERGDTHTITVQENLYNWY